MRILTGLSAAALPALALLATAPFAQAQPYGAPRGSYQSACSNIRMDGQFLSATCRGARGSGRSSINVQSCASDISVDPTGGLVCTGPGAAAPAPGTPYGRPQADQRAAPGSTDGRDRNGDRYDNRGQAYGGGYRDDRNGGYRDDRNGRGRYSATLFGRRDMRGQSFAIRGDTANLSQTGLNDRVRSIQLDPGSRPWIVCTDADYKGRCVTISRSVSDVRDIGMTNAISSMRPAR